MTTLETKRLIKSGLTNFLRNIWISIAATSMVAITLFIISIIIVLYALTSVAIQNSTDKIGVVTAYFNQQTTDKEVQNVITEIKGLEGVREVNYTTKEEAIAQFKLIHQNEPNWIESLNEFTDAENPLTGSIAEPAYDLTDYSRIYDTLKGQRYAPYFQNVRDNQTVINKLYRIIQFITRFGILLAAIFMVVTVMVTFNTIRLTIYNRREEVEIMRLVGATNWYIRWPFMIEGILYSLIATVLTSLIILILLILLSGRIEQFLSIQVLGSSLISALFWRILLVNLAASIVLSAIASSIAMRRYLKV